MVISTYFDVDFPNTPQGLARTVNELYTRAAPCCKKSYNQFLFCWPATKKYNNNELIDLPIPALVFEAPHDTHVEQLLEDSCITEDDVDSVVKVGAGGIGMGARVSYACIRTRTHTHAGTCSHTKTQTYLLFSLSALTHFVAPHSCTFTPKEVEEAVEKNKKHLPPRPQHGTGSPLINHPTTEAAASPTANTVTNADSLASSIQVYIAWVRIYIPNRSINIQHLNTVPLHLPNAAPGATASIKKGGNTGTILLTVQAR